MSQIHSWQVGPQTIYLTLLHTGQIHHILYIQSCAWLFKHTLGETWSSCVLFFFFHKDRLFLNISRPYVKNSFIFWPWTLESDTLWDYVATSLFCLDDLSLMHQSVLRIHMGWSPCKHSKVPERSTKQGLRLKLQEILTNNVTLASVLKMLGLFIIIHFLIFQAFTF